MAGKNVGGGKWAKVAPVDFRMQGDELEPAIPRAALGLPAGSTRAALDFKWSHHLQHPGDIMDFYLSGDVAPAGRFNFRYEED